VRASVECRAGRGRLWALLESLGHASDAVTIDRDLAAGSRTPLSNPGSALLVQSKRFPLV
jgi:hypothetical protein